MSALSGRRGPGLALFASIALLAAVAGPVSAEAPPDMTLQFPAGIACADFDLKAEAWGMPKVYREFTNGEDAIVRTLAAGLGSELLLTNMATGATVSYRANGFTATTLPNGDGTSTFVLTGHQVVFMYPTDHPAGPTTTLYVGRVAYHVVDATQEYTLLEAAGRAIDICAVLAP